MSNNRFHSQPKHYANHNQSIPRQWLSCRRRGDVIAGKFVAFKTPLDERYANQLNNRDLFTPQMFISELNASNLSLGVWIDLTNTSRYYDSRIVDRNHIKYVKLVCKGHDESPPLSQTREFIAICDKQFRRDHTSLICVHCTHGFNRTGFMICSYLIETLHYSVENALNAFRNSRPPGIYKQHCIDELFARYDRNGYNRPQTRVNMNSTQSSVCRDSRQQNGYNRPHPNVHTQSTTHSTSIRESRQRNRCHISPKNYRPLPHAQTHPTTQSTIWCDPRQQNVYNRPHARVRMHSTQSKVCRDPHRQNRRHIN